MSIDVIDFTHSLRYADIPEEARHAGRRALLDTLGVAAAGSTTRSSRILRDHAASFHGAARQGARLLFDGRRVAPQGAALAGAGTIDSVDAHDGHPLTKGHMGVAVVPALLAFSDELAPSDGAELLTRLVLGYEIATRAGVTLHATVSDYHTSGAWNALGVAAMGARALGLSTDLTGHALGIAEYYGPRSQMMRVIDHPSMLKDGSAMGAMSGVSAALLAAEGFTGAPAITVMAEAVAAFWQDLGRRWCVEEQYIKPYPVCRWAQPAVDAVLSLLRADGQPVIPASQVAKVTIHSFAEATRLAMRSPATTDDAQYSLPFPVAAAMVHGRLGMAEIDGPGLLDPEVLHLSQSVEMVAEQRYDDRFPAERWAHAVIDLADGRRLVSEPFSARGDPEQPLDDKELVEKLVGLAGPVIGTSAAEELAGRCFEIDKDGNIQPLLEIAFNAARRAPRLNNVTESRAG